MVPGLPTTSVDLTGPHTAKETWLRRIAAAGLAIGGIAVLWLMPTRQALTALIGWVEQFEAWAMLVFVVVYAAAVMLALPSTPLILAGGLLFGMFWGFAGSLVGAAISAIGGFLVARHLLGRWMARRLDRHPRFAAVKEAVDAKGWRMVLLARLNPLLPASMQNYYFGVTSIDLWPYFWASMLGQAPWLLMYAWCGSVGNLSLTYSQRQWSAGHYALFGGGLVLSVVLIVAVTRFGYQSLQELDTASPAITGDDLQEEA
jgi:uncharacterized membrane protein YdjX (TVP38/TMEM64 family)